MPGSLCLYVSGMASLRRTTLSRDMYAMPRWIIVFACFRCGSSKGSHNIRRSVCLDHCVCMFQVWQL